MDEWKHAPTASHGIHACIVRNGFDTPQPSILFACCTQFGLHPPSGGYQRTPSARSARNGRSREEHATRIVSVFLNRRQDRAETVSIAFCAN